MQSGEVLELCDDYAKVVDKVHTGAILVDGLGVGDVGNIVFETDSILQKMVSLL